jgi:putative acyl-CoA dehydrogenase
MECLGGNGYVEEGGQGMMARIYREMPLNSIWEGAGNIMAIDLLRALRKADAAAALAHELAPAKGAHPRWTGWPRAAHARGRNGQRAGGPPPRAGRGAGRAGRAAVPDRAAAVFAAFCDSRLAGNWGQAFGTLGAGTGFRHHHRAPNRADINQEPHA